MKVNLSLRHLALAILSATLLVSLPLIAEEDKGESKAESALKIRQTPPKQAEMNKNATIQALLEKKGPKDWSNTQGAQLEGYVIQVENEEDGDVHLVIASAPGEPNTQKWVVTEVTPAWQKKKAELSKKSLKSLIGKHVRVSGWLYLEPDQEQDDPRGTPWEIHPVTAIEKIE